MRLHADNRQRGRNGEGLGCSARRSPVTPKTASDGCTWRRTDADAPGDAPDVHRRRTCWAIASFRAPGPAISHDVQGIGALLRGLLYAGRTPSQGERAARRICFAWPRSVSSRPRAFGIDAPSASIGSISDFGSAFLSRDRALQRNAPERSRPGKGALNADVPGTGAWIPASGSSSLGPSIRLASLDIGNGRRTQLIAHGDPENDLPERIERDLAEARRLPETAVTPEFPDFFATRPAKCRLFAGFPRGPGRQAPSHASWTHSPAVVRGSAARRLRGPLLCSHGNQRKSALVKSALEQYLRGTADATLVMRLLDRLGRAGVRTQRDLELLSEAFVVYVRLWSRESSRSRGCR